MDYYRHEGDDRAIYSKSYYIVLLRQTKVNTNYSNGVKTPVYCNNEPQIIFTQVEY